MKSKTATIKPILVIKMNGSDGQSSLKDFLTFDKKLN